MSDIQHNKDIQSLLDEIVNQHHQYLKDELPMIGQFASKIARVHGPNNDDRLYELDRLYHELQQQIEEYMQIEEQQLFPLMQQYTEDAATLHTDQLQHTNRALREKQQKLNDLLQQMRAVTSDYTLPEHACRTYTITFNKLGELERNLFAHIQLESDVILPKILDEAQA